MYSPLEDFYRVPNIELYQDAPLLDLSENCAFLEEKVLAIAKTLPEQQRQIIEAYILALNDLEVETLKAAFRWGRDHYRK